MENPGQPGGRRAMTDSDRVTSKEGRGDEWHRVRPRPEGVSREDCPPPGDRWLDRRRAGGGGRAPAAGCGGEKRSGAGSSTRAAPRRGPAAATRSASLAAAITSKPSAPQISPAAGAAAWKGSSATRPMAAAIAATTWSATWPPTTPFAASPRSHSGARGSRRFGIRRTSATRTSRAGIANCAASPVPGQLAPLRRQGSP